jgi:cyclopropane-fatty-acyl-phospholipid synthase
VLHLFLIVNQNLTLQQCKKVLIMSTQTEIEVSYDIDNEFFRLWLDKTMSYTCGVHDGVETEEEAQRQKLVWLSNAARVTPSKRVLEIGCGWGACLGVSHCSYLDFKPDKKFDAIISIGMLEHIVTAEQGRSGKHIDIYRNYFKLTHEWTNPGSWFGLHHIITIQIPRNKKDLHDLVWTVRTIFPGAYSPRIEDVIMNLHPYWELMEIRTRRLDYAKTTAEWLRRLYVHETLIRKQWGDRVFENYDRYLQTCVRLFERNNFSLAQYALRRLD